MSNRSSKPILSVCLITYNQKQYIRQSIDSILSQKTNFNWELVIADDCSTDGTREIVQEYKQKHPDLIKLILQTKNVGPEANWFDLITYPKTKYMLYAEGDDYFTDPNKLQMQLDFLESHPDYAICFHPVRVFYENHEVEDYIAPSKEQKGKGDLRQLVKGNFFYTNSVMCRRQDYRNLPRNIVPLDWYMHLYNAKFGKIGYINTVMSAYRRHPGSIWWDSAKDIDKVWSKYGLQHMAMFVEMLKLFPEHKAYRTIIINHINNGFERLVSADTKYGSHQLNSVVEELPELTADYIRSQTLVSSNTNMIEELSRDLAATKQKLAETQTAGVLAAAQLKAIKSSRFWKLRDAITKTIHKI